MKKIISFLTALLLVLSVCGCSLKNTEQTKNDSDVPSTEDLKVDEPAENTMSMTQAKELFDRNLKCTLDIFDLSTLEYDETPLKDSFCPIKDDTFKTFAALEEFVKSTYVKEVADRLLYSTRPDGRPLYKEVDGVFCIDTSIIGGKGYYVNWENYDISASGDENTCDITVTATIEEPSDNPKPEPYLKNAKAEKIDGKWLLTEVVY